MSSRNGRFVAAFRGLGLAVAFILVAGAAAWVWNLGATAIALQQRAYPIPSTHNQDQTAPDYRALQVEARQAATADTALLVALGQLALGVAGVGGVGFTIFYARLAWREAERSANAAQEALLDTKNETAAQIARYSEQLKIAAEGAAAAKEHARVAGEVLQHNQSRVVLTERAYMTRTHMEVRPIKPPPGDVLETLLIVPTWTNIGRTPARELVCPSGIPIILEVGQPVIDPGFTFPPDNKRPSMIIGVREPFQAGPVTILPDDVERCARGEARIFLWLRAEYRDVFPGTPLRCTQYIEEMRYIGMNADFRISEFIADLRDPHDQREWPFVFATLTDMSVFT